MTVGDFCDKVGYDRGNAARLIQAYRDIVFEWGNVYQRFCSFVYEPDKTDMCIFCNPHIFYTGSDYKKVEALGLFFAPCNKNGTVIRNHKR